jgi:hypothetical protein
MRHAPLSLGGFLCSRDRTAEMQAMAGEGGWGWTCTSGCVVFSSLSCWRCFSTRMLASMFFPTLFSDGSMGSAPPVVRTDRDDLVVCGSLTFLSGAVMGGGNLVYVLEGHPREGTLMLRTHSPTMSTHTHPHPLSTYGSQQTTKHLRAHKHTPCLTRTGFPMFFSHAALLTLAYVCSKWSFVHCKRLADLCDRYIRGDASGCCFCVADTWGGTLTSESHWRLCTRLAPSSDPAPAPLMWMTSLPACTTCHRASPPCLARAPPSLSTRTLLVTSAGACVGSPRARYLSLHVDLSRAWAVPGNSDCLA